MAAPEGNTVWKEQLNSASSVVYYFSSEGF